MCVGGGQSPEIQILNRLVESSAAGTQEAVAVAWPVRQGSADGVIAFVCRGADREESALISEGKRSLPEYMVSRQGRFVDDFPLNVNGKIDRKRLAQIADEGGR